MGGRDLNHLQEKQIQKGKMIVWGVVTNNWEKKRSENQRRKGYTHVNADFQSIAKRDKKAFWSKKHKETEENKSGKD